MGCKQSKRSDKLSVKNIENDQQTDRHSFDYTFKILVLGDAGVGKTSLFIRFTDGKFIESNDDNIITLNQSNQQIDSKEKVITLEDGRVCKLQIWDTAGQERWRTLTSSFYRGANGVLLVYDITDKTSFSNCRQWLEDVKLYTCEDVVVLFVGNKSDLASARAVDANDVTRFTQKNALAHIECSAKSNVNVSAIFEKLTMQIIDLIGK